MVSLNILQISRDTEHAERIAGVEQEVVKMRNRWAMWLFDHHVQLSHMVTVIFWFESAFHLEADATMDGLT